MNEHSTITGFDLGEEKSQFAVMLSQSEEIVEEGALKTTNVFSQRHSVDGHNAVPDSAPSWQTAAPPSLTSSR